MQPHIDRESFPQRGLEEKGNHGLQKACIEGYLVGRVVEPGIMDGQWSTIIRTPSEQGLRSLVFCFPGRMVAITKFPGTLE